MDDQNTTDRREHPDTAPSGSSRLTHTIRLGPPWQTTTTTEGTRHARKFGRPRTLDVNERLWLVCKSVPGPAEICINGVILGTTEITCHFAADITSFLQPRNEIVFDVTATGQLGEVTLEVRTN